MHTYTHTQTHNIFIIYGMVLTIHNGYINNIAYFLGFDLAHSASSNKHSEKVKATTLL